MGRNFETVRCPNHKNHSMSSDLTETVLFIPGAGYDDYAFNCKHAGCSHITTSDFFSAAGVDLLGFDAITDQDEIEVQRAFDLTRRNELIVSGVSPVSGPRFTRDKAGKILWEDSNNIAEALRHPDFGGLLISYDRFLDRVMISELKEDGTPGPIRPLRDSDRARFIMRCTRRGFKPGYPINPVRYSFDVVAEEREVDTAKDWLNGLPEWDRVRRVDDFCSTYLGVTPSPYSRAVGRYWWTAHAGRVLEPGCQADMAVCLISGQGTGKTSTVKAMVPNDEWFCELNFDRDDDDLSRAMRGKLIGEIAELRGLADGRSEAIKARVSRRKESWIQKYHEDEHVFYRRLVLVATGNNPEFLSDETGNRRWLPIEVGEKQQIDKLVRDRDQLWTEAAHLWREGGVQWKEAQTLAKAEHANFEVRDAWEETVAEWLQEEGLGGERAGDLEFLTVRQVLEGALRLDPNKQQLRDQHRIGRVMKQLGYEKRVRRDGGQLFKAWFKV